MLDSAELRSLATANGLATASVVVRRLDGKQSTSTHLADQLIYPASMIKLPIAMALAERCAGGLLTWDERVLVEEPNLTANDAPSPFAAGLEARLGDLMDAMIAKSDNVATNVLIDVLGRETIGPSCERFGCRATAVRRKLSGSLPLIDDPLASGRNTHPPSDAALLFAALAEPTSSAFGRVRAALTAQIWNEKLSRGWNSGDRFAHKTGDTDDVSHDGGILDLENGSRYVIVVYTEFASNPETDATFARFARALRPLLR